nr:NADH dehydrogenase subunit 4L [Chiropterargas confusus]
MLSVGVMIYLVGMTSMLMKRVHMLLMMLCLEFMNMGVLYSVYVNLSYKYYHINFISFLVFMVCEAGLGLSILVINVYFYGNDKISLLSLVKW